MRGALGRLSGWQRAALGVAVVVVGINLLATAVGALVPSPSGPASSSYATAPRGIAAYAELLEREGHPVRRLRERPDRAQLDPAATVVLLEPDVLVADEVRALRRFVEEGGRLVAGGARSQLLLEGLLGAGAPELSRRGPSTWRAEGSAPEAGRALEVRSSGEGAFLGGGESEPVVSEAGGGRSLVLAGGVGRGRALLLADASPLQNRLLAQADDAALGLGLAGDAGRPVHFLESVHGYGQGRGLAALPGSWKLALGGLALAGLLFVLSRARRLGPPDPEPPPRAPARGAYVGALGAALERTGDAAAATETLRRSAREVLAERQGAAAVASPDAVRESALRAGLSAEEAAALAGAGGGEDELVAAGRGLGRLREGSRRT